MEPRLKSFTRKIPPRATARFTGINNGQRASPACDCRIASHLASLADNRRRPSQHPGSRRNRKRKQRRRRRLARPCEADQCGRGARGRPKRGDVRTNVRRNSHWRRCSKQVSKLFIQRQYLVRTSSVTKQVVCMCAIGVCYIRTNPLPTLNCRIAITSYVINGISLCFLLYCIYLPGYCCPVCVTYKIQFSYFSSYCISRESQTTRNVNWSCASVCVCPSPHSYTTARTWMQLGEMVGDAPQLCIIGRICNRCTGFVAMTTQRERENVSECSVVLALCLVIIIYAAIVR